MKASPVPTAATADVPPAIQSRYIPPGRSPQQSRPSFPLFSPEKCPSTARSRYREWSKNPLCPPSCTGCRSVAEARAAQSDSAADSSCEQKPAILSGASPFSPFCSFPLPSIPNDRKQYSSADQKAGSIESGRAHIIHSHALRHESSSPDGSGQKQHQAGLNGFSIPFHLLSFRFFLS